MKRLLVMLACLLAHKHIFAQVAISYFPVQSILSVSTQTDKRLFADFKIETNNFISNLNMEFSPKFNLRRLEKANYYTGIGISLNPVNSLLIIPILLFSFYYAQTKPDNMVRNCFLQVGVNGV